MALADHVRPAAKPNQVWLIVGAGLLIYAALGNWLVLPGYRRFLDQGSSGARSNAPDLALIWGAARTILWMLSFHLGALCLAVAALAARGETVRRFRGWFMVGALAWVALWAIPTLPGPYTAFFAATGIVILGAIATVFIRTTAHVARGGSFIAAERGHWQIASLFFFALATWDMCGLGSVGGILHPAGTVRSASQGLVVAQTTKLIIELALAWILLAMATLTARRA